jgi:hypothetical protein
MLIKVDIDGGANFTITKGSSSLLIIQAESIGKIYFLSTAVD